MILKKAIEISAWVTAIILFLLFVSAGYPKISPNQSMINRFLNWGYSQEFAQFIGGFELLGGILLLVPRASLYASLGLLLLMFGAVYTHVSTDIGSPWFAIITAILLTTNTFLWYKRNSLRRTKNQEPSTVG